MATNYPVSLDTTTNLPTRATGDVIPASDSNDKRDAVIAIETKVGIDSSTPTSNKVLRATGTGTSSWAQVNLATDVTGSLPGANMATMVGDSGSGGTKGATPAPAIGDATKFLRGDATWATPSGAGDVSSNTATSVDNEIVLFNSTTGKSIKRATGTGIAKITSGVLSTATSGTDYAPATSGSGVLKGDGAGGTSTATAGTDYTSPTGSESLSNKTIGNTNTVTIKDTNLTIQDDADTTKQVQIQASGITTGTTRTLTVPNASGTLALTSDLSSYQPLDSDLTTIAGLTATTDSFIQSKASAWSSRTPTQVTADLIAMVGDSGSGGTKGLAPAPSAGDTAAGKFLKADGTWTVPAGGGQTLVTKVVAASGGDYTTLGAAIAAASAGWVIFVKPGTYTESTLTSTLTNLSIVGLSPFNTTIDIGTNNWTLSGADVHMFGVGFTGSTGTLTVSGASVNVDYCRFVWSNNPTGSSVVISGTGTQIQRSYFKNSTNATRTVANFTFNGSYSSISDCYFVIDTKNTTVGAIDMSSGSYSTFANNGVESLGNTLNGWGIRPSIGHTVSGNYFKNFNLTNSSYFIYADNAKVMIVGNTCDGGRLYSAGAGNSITANQITSNASGSCIEVNSSEMTVTGNTCRSNGTSVGVQVDSGNYTGITISSNTFYVMSTCVSLASNNNGNIITGNHFDPLNSTTAISDSGFGNSFYNNMGTDDTNEKKCVYVKNTSGSSLSRGQVVVYKAAAGGNEVTTTTTAGDKFVYGMAEATITNNSFGYIQLLGKTTQLKANGTTAIAVGDMLSCFTTAGICKKASAGEMVFAIALEAYSTADSNGVLDALLITPRLI